MSSMFHFSSGKSGWEPFSELKKTQPEEMDGCVQVFFWQTGGGAYAVLKHQLEAKDFDDIMSIVPRDVCGFLAMIKKEQVFGVMWAPKECSIQKYHMFTCWGEDDLRRYIRPTQRFRAFTVHDLKEAFYAFDSLLKRKDILAIADIENEMRLSAEYQEKYSLKDDVPHHFAVSDEIQRNALRKFGIQEDDIEKALNEYRSVRMTYKDDTEFLESLKDKLIYMKYDRSRKGSLEVGDFVSEESLSSVIVYKLEDEVGKPLSIFKNDKPLVLLAGSYT
eukprot:TRINITY_DN2888_c0_g1_i2.p1 TRINITY_DN2888_c0_g1~~TRINITY_DN2888_c0_g1_i2.p1  ORF type:complete len:276 (-),score=50.29 TRINITY_DN2888_c0_g1_i2:634-1461(-)